MVNAISLRSQRELAQSFSKGTIALPGVNGSRCCRCSSPTTFIIQNELNVAAQNLKIDEPTILGRRRTFKFYILRLRISNHAPHHVFNSLIISVPSLLTHPCSLNPNAHSNGVTFFAMCHPGCSTQSRYFRRLTRIFTSAPPSNSFRTI